MMRKIYSTFLIVMVAWASLLAQSGSIKGKVVDATTNEPLPFANVVVELNGSQAGGSQTDFDGNFTIKPLNPGKYNLKASYVGYQATGVNGIIVSLPKKISFLFFMAEIITSILSMGIYSGSAPLKPNITAKSVA